MVHFRPPVPGDVIKSGMFIFRTCGSIRKRSTNLMVVSPGRWPGFSRPTLRKVREGWGTHRVCTPIVFLVSGVYGLEGVDDSVQICRAFPFIGGAEDVEEFVAAVEAVEGTLAGFAGFVLQAFEVRQGNLLQRAADYGLICVLVGFRFVPEIGEGGFAVGQAVNHAQAEDTSALQTNGVEVD